MTLAPREWRTVRRGLLVLGLGVGVTRGVLPLWDHWHRQGTRLTALRQRVAEAEGLRLRQGALEMQATALERRLADAPRRLIQGRTAGVAASALEGMLQGAVEAAGAQLQRLAVEPLPEDGAVAPLPTVHATLSAVGDVEGLAQLLAQLATGPRPVQVDRLVVQRNPALRGAPDVLQWTVSVRAPVVMR